MEITYTLSDQEIFECFVEILSLPDAELRAKLKEYTGEVAGELHYFRKSTPTNSPWLASDAAKDMVERDDKRMSTILARITLLRENL
jgi:hypothetical protein